MIGMFEIAVIDTSDGEELLVDSYSDEIKYLTKNFILAKLAEYDTFQTPIDFMLKRVNKTLFYVFGIVKTENGYIELMNDTFLELQVNDVTPEDLSFFKKSKGINNWYEMVHFDIMHKTAQKSFVKASAQYSVNPSASNYTALLHEMQVYQKITNAFRSKRQTFKSYNVFNELI